MTESDRKAIDQLYLQMYAKLFEYARSTLSNDALAEEAVQDTFAIACQKPDALLSSPNPPGWLVITLKNVISNTIRRQQTAQRILSDYCADHGMDDVSSHDHLDLKTLYGELSQTEDFLLLKEMAVDGKSYRQMAVSRGISLAACRKRVPRAREKLQKKIPI